MDRVWQSFRGHFSVAAAIARNIAHAHDNKELLRSFAVFQISWLLRINVRSI